MSQFSKLNAEEKSAVVKHLLGCILSLAAFLVIIFIVLFAFYGLYLTNDTFVDPYEQQYRTYLIKFGKTCKNDKEFRQRLNYFRHSMREIESLNNAPNRTANYGWTKFSDMSTEEFSTKMLLPGRQGYICNDYAKNCTTDFPAKFKDTDIPDKFDWRTRGVVGPVLDQGLKCLICWAISIVGVMESMLMISGQTTEYLQLSTQELSDCATSKNYTKGCKGGLDVEALKYLCYEGTPLTLAREYPLTLKDQECQMIPQAGVTVSSFFTKCDLSADDIARLVATHGPVTAAVDAIPWQNYLGGIIRYHCSDDWSLITHVVQIVGYDKTDGVAHFILKNSWGEDFGERGYVRVAMDGFVCAVGRQISYLTVLRTN